MKEWKPIEAESADQRVRLATTLAGRIPAGKIMALDADEVNALRGETLSRMAWTPERTLYILERVFSAADTRVRVELRDKTFTVQLVPPPMSKYPMELAEHALNAGKVTVEAVESKAECPFGHRGRGLSMVLKQERGRGGDGLGAATCVVVCRVCGAKGPTELTRAEAMRAWENRR
jgi:hypothetical protein